MKRTAPIFRCSQSKTVCGNCLAAAREVAFRHGLCGAYQAHNRPSLRTVNENPKPTFRKHGEQWAFNAIHWLHSALSALAFDPHLSAILEEKEQGGGFLLSPLFFVMIFSECPKPELAFVF